MHLAFLSVVFYLTSVVCGVNIEVRWETVAL